MVKQKIKILLNQISKHENIVICSHVSPDGDSLGSQWGLYEWLKTNFKRNIIIVGENPIGNLKEIFPLAINEKKLKLNWKKTLVIIVDTANKERICIENWKKANFIFKIDHHPEVEDYSNEKIIDTNNSSTCQILAEIFRLFEYKFITNKMCAQYLYIGILTDTGRFVYDSADKKTFEVVAWLLGHDFDKTKITNIVFKRSLKSIKYSQKVYENLKITKNKVVYAIMPKNSHKEVKLDYESASAMVYLLSGISKCFYSLYATWDEKAEVWKVSLRSRKDAINEIAKKFGGGGHPKAAATKVKTEKEIKEIIQNMDELAQTTHE